MVSPLEVVLGDTIGRTYLVQRELGGGGMSRVFLAEERALGRQVVIKVLAPELAEGLSAERFAREITVAASLQQPNIVPVLTAGDVDGLPYYTMPFIEGRSLRERLADGPSRQRSSRSRETWCARSPTRTARHRAS
jgi:serine/threonine-protein kinase